MEKHQVEELKVLINRAGEKLVDSFYHQVLEHSAELANIFRNTDLAEQKKRMKEGLEEILSLQAKDAELHEYLQDLGFRHLGYEVEESHYAIIRAALLSSFQKYSNLSNSEIEIFVDSVLNPMQEGTQQLVKVASNG